MNPIPAQALQSPATGAAMLVLDAAGRVQLASAAACALWHATARELTGDRFPNLFVFEVTSQAADWQQAQWEVLVAAAESQPLRLRLQPKETGEFDVQVRLERVDAEPPHYLAFIEVPAPAAPVVLTAPPAATPTAAAADTLAAQLHDRSPLGFFELNFVRQEAYYSPAWKRMLGYTDQTLANRYDSWVQLIHPEDTAAAPDRQARAGAAGARPFSYEYRMRHAGGHYVWVQCVGVQHFGPNGALQRVVGAHLDISDRKDFEEAALRSDERLQLLGERNRAGFFDLDLAQGTYWLSPGFKALLGYAEGELPNSLESVLRSLPMDETAGGLGAYFLAQQPGQLSYFDTLRLRHRDGRTLAVHACIVRQISRQKELQRVVGLVVALPEAAVVANDGLAAPHLAALLDELHEGVLVAGADGKIVELNAKAEKLLGRTRADCLGVEVGEIFRLVHVESGQPGENPVARALGAGEPTALTTEFALEIGGSATPVVFSARAVPHPAGGSAGAVVVFRFPGEMTLTPEELVRANRFEALGQLAGGIAHDFNNLLTTILGGVSLARVERNYSGLENAERACTAAKSLTKQLLGFSRGGTGVRQVLNPTDILKDSVRLASAGSTVKIEVAAAPDTGTVCVDRAQMLQVFQNLIINAIQAMTTGKGEIWVNAANVALAAGEVSPLPAGTYVAIEVKDNGSGIKPEILERIFDPFFTTKKSGTGLGLATVLSIVKRHGGQIGVTSELGVGTAFTVFLPMADQPKELEARPAPWAPADKRTGRVLFMDDDPSICELTGHMLDSIALKYDIARNGEEAIKLYKRYLNIGRPYDVVIMDLTIIGGMGGEECFKALRELHPQVRAIIASGYDSDDMKRQFLDLGFYGYLTKPYRASELDRVIKKVLGA